MRKLNAMLTPLIGCDTIAEYDPAAGNVDTIKFADTTIAPGNIVFSLSGSDLVLNNTVSGDQLTIKDYALGEAHRIERVEFQDGTVWDAAYLQSQVAALLPVASFGDLRWRTRAAIINSKAGNDDAANAWRVAA